MPFDRQAYMREYGRRRYAEQKKRILQQHKEYYEANKEAVLETNRRYRESNKEHIRQAQRRYRSTPEGRRRRQISESTANAKARHVVKRRVFYKKWPPASFFLCTDCNNKAQHYHHPDYSFPLWVEPLCIPCHLLIHNDKP